MDSADRIHNPMITLHAIDNSNVLEWFTTKNAGYEFRDNKGHLEYKRTEKDITWRAYQTMEDARNQMETYIERYGKNG